MMQAHSVTEAGPPTDPHAPTREEVLAEAEDYERKAERAGSPAKKTEYLRHARALYTVVAHFDQQRGR